MFRVMFVGLAFLMSVTVAEARDLKVATWNLGWHLSKAEAADWIDKCGQPFALNAAGDAFEPATMGQPGWTLNWDRNATVKPKWDISVLPPCSVYLNNSFDVVPVTKAAYDKRDTQIANFISKELDADVFAFEEVSGEQAVREVLPGGGADYNVCSFTGYKVQRLAFAWRKSLGAATRCQPEDAVSLPAVSDKDRVRPGLELELNIDGKPIRFLAVHLKSSCVSPLDAGSDPQRGHLDGSDPNCIILQQQPTALEAWIERDAPFDGRLVMMGDFNRSLWYESQATDQVRTDGSDPTTALPSGVKVVNLFKEVFDGAPTNTSLTLLHETCRVNAASTAICDDMSTYSDATKRKEARKTLAFKENLGCRNPIELDHILVGVGLTANPAEKVAIGNRGRTLPANDTHPDPLLSISDHCPLMATVGL